MYPFSIVTENKEFAAAGPMALMTLTVVYNAHQYSFRSNCRVEYLAEAVGGTE